MFGPNEKPPTRAEFIPNLLRNELLGRLPSALTGHFAKDVTSAARFTAVA